MLDPHGGTVKRGGNVVTKNEHEGRPCAFSSAAMNIWGPGRSGDTMAASSQPGVFATGKEVPNFMKHAALGFRAHSGWTALVAVSLEKDGPRVLVRQRPELVERFTYELRQPYHTAEKLPADQAREFVSRIESAAQRMAEEAIGAVQADLRQQGYRLAWFGLLLSSARPLPSLDKILSSHALIHTADGELFRRALIYGSRRCRLTAFTIAERELLAFACKTLRFSPDDLTRRLTALGKSMGSPWSQDEKFAALAAWLALRAREGTSSRGSAAPLTDE
jgi:hypothetical protein